jgi:uncharacterized protein with HEPN domain
VRASSADLIAEALLHLAVIRDHVAEEGLESDLGMDAASMRLSAAIERLTHLPPELQEAACGEDWPAVRAMRNRIAHGYFTLDRGAVRDTVLHDLGPLEERLREIHGALDPPA